MKRISKKFLREFNFLVAGILFLGLVLNASAFTGPSAGCTPGGTSACNSSFSVDANGNVGFGTTRISSLTSGNTYNTPPFGSFANVFMIAATSSPPGIALRNIGSGGSGNGSYGIMDATWVWQLTPWGAITLTNAGTSFSYNRNAITVFPDNRIVLPGPSGSGSGWYPATSTLSVIGDISASSGFVGIGANLTGVAPAGVSGGAFSSANYAFPLNLAIGTSTTANLPKSLSVYGGGYFRDSVGIGMTNPIATLSVAGSSTISNALNVNSGTLFVDAVNSRVGIGTTGPGSALDVSGTGNFTGTVAVATPTAAGHAATKAYVDSSVGGSGGAASFATLTVGSLNGVGKWTSGVAGTATSGIDYQSPLTFPLIYASTTHVVATTPLSITAGVLSMPTSTASQNGFLTSADWTTFNNKSTAAGANPTATIGLTANNGTASTFIRSDASPALGVAIAPTWTGIHTFSNGTYSALFTGGNVGIGTSTPSYKLDVVGTAQFSQPVIVGTPTANSHAATKSYVDSAITGGGSVGSFTTLTVSGTSTFNGNIQFGGQAVTNLSMNGKNITGVNKLTVTTIDPLYRIGGVNYSTYAASIAGGVKEEYVGRGKLVPISNEFSYVIDFNNVKSGSDLWLWRETVDFSPENVEVLATPYGVPVPIAYTIEESKIIFVADLGKLNFQKEVQLPSIDFSYRLIGKRFDWRDWPTYAKDQNEPAGLIIR